MMRPALLALLLALSPSFVACGGGDDGDNVSRQRVFPSTGFTGRTLTVEISADDTNWKSGATVDFGPGVTVGTVTVDSPTVITAQLTVAFDTAPGLRDVVITSGGDKLTLKEGFQLESPFTVKFLGTLAQGSVATFAINNHDIDTPFDTTSEGDGFFEPLTFPNIVIEGPTGIEFSIDSVTEYAITGIALIDVNAAPGSLVVNSGPSTGTVVKSHAGKNVEVAARTAMALTSGTPATGTVVDKLGSALYEFSTTANPDIATMFISSTNPDADPGVIVLGPSGSFDEIISFTNDFASIVPAGKLYAIVWDNTGAENYPYSLRAASLQPTTTAENEPANNTATTASTVAKPIIVTGGQIADATDQDWYAIDVVAADVGKRINILTSGTDPQTDTRVQVFTGANGTTAFGGPVDRNFHERHRTAAITTAGKYWVKVDASTEYDPAHKPYVVAVWIE